MSFTAINTQVISLATAHDRREHIKQEFGSRGVDFEFFDALTPSDVDRVDRELGIALSDSPRQSPGEKACFASHVFLWRRLLDSGEKYLAIFEDDVRLSGDIAEFLSVEFCESLPDFDILKLETHFMYIRLGKSVALRGDRKIQRLMEKHYGTAAYIVSRQGALQLLQKTQEAGDDLQPIDCMIFDRFIGDLNVYQLNPAPCAQLLFLPSDPNRDKIPSQIESDRALFLQENAITRNTDPSNFLHFHFFKLTRSIKKRLGLYFVVNFR